MKRRFWFFLLLLILFYFIFPVSLAKSARRTGLECSKNALFREVFGLSEDEAVEVFSGQDEAEFL